MIVWTLAVLGVLYACVLYFCICTSSAQLRMFHMERRSRNTLIIIIICSAGSSSSSRSSSRSSSSSSSRSSSSSSSIICIFCLSVAARKIVSTDSSLRHTFCVAWT